MIVNEISLIIQNIKEKKKEKHHQTGKTKDSSLVSVFIGGFLFLSNFSLVFLLDHLSRHVQKNETYEKLKEMKIAKDRKVIPDPIDDRKFHSYKGLIRELSMED